MSKLAVWLEKGGDRVLVDLGSRAEGYWRGIGYAEVGLVVETSLPDQPLAAEKTVKKVRDKKVVAEA